MLPPYAHAVADFTHVLKLDPTNANAFFNRGSAHDALGDFDAALRDYTTALELDGASVNLSSADRSSLRSLTGDTLRLRGLRVTQGSL